MNFLNQIALDCYSTLRRKNSNICKQADPTPPPDIISDKGFNFRVFKASGGTIVETFFYDRVRDNRNRNSLYVITEDKDLGQEIGKIITMESLKQ